MTSTREAIRTAVEGTVFTASIGPDREQVAYTVGPSCGVDHGTWYCITHEEPFRNNLMKDHHIERGQHVMVWICLNHGPEQP